MTDKKDKILELYLSGYGYKKIARELSIGIDCVKYTIKKSGQKKDYKTLEPKNCSNCGKEFIPSVLNQVRCSECGTYVHRKKPIDVVCHGCGKTFQTTSKSQMWCSKECQTQWHKTHCSKTRKSTAVHEERICLKCGESFISSNAKQKFCSRKCEKSSHKYYERTQDEINNEAFKKKIDLLDEYGFDYVSGYENQKSIIEIKCQKCGAFKSVRVDSIREQRKIICRNCFELESNLKAKKKQDELNAKRQLVSVLKGVQRIKKTEEKETERQKRWEETHQPRKCKCCEKEFIPNTLHQEKCEACGKRRKEKRVPKEKRNRSLTWKTLWENGEHICALCGNECNPEDYKIREDGTIVVGETYPSLDHIIPVFMGGGDYIDNVQVACYRCNTMRGVREWQEHRSSQKTLRA